MNLKLIKRKLNFFNNLNWTSTNLIFCFLAILCCEGDDDDGYEDGQPDQVADGQQGGGHNAVIAANPPPPVVENYPRHDGRK